MEFITSLLRILDTDMETPTMFGWFHLLSWALVIAFTVFLCVLHKKRPSERRVRAVVLGVAITVAVFEIYKIINFSVGYEDGTLTFEFPWYIFPWQFCSTPMYAGLLTGIFRRGKVHDALCAFLATYAIFAGCVVMIYPGDVFMDTIGINIQTMICHGSMIVVGIYLWYSGYVKTEHKTILKALPVFAVAIGIAMILNEIANASGLLAAGHGFNMFYISPYFECTLPVLSSIYPNVPFIVFILIYSLGFLLVAFLLYLIQYGICALARRSRRA